jgi:hypothetical protein
MNVPDRIYSQYRTKPKAVKWFDIARKMGGSLEAAAIAVRNMYDIDSNVGAQLDIIGRIVVLNRDFIGVVQLFPGLFDATEGDQCGDDVNAVFSESSTATDSVMNDEIYRIALRAKIFKNNGDATIESILEAMFVVAPDVDYVQVLDTEEMSFAIEFAGDVTNIQQWALFNINLVQKPQGVQFLGFNDITDILVFDEDEIQFGDTEAQFAKIRSS